MVVHGRRLRTLARWPSFDRIGPSIGRFPCTHASPSPARPDHRRRRVRRHQSVPCRRALRRFRGRTAATPACLRFRASHLFHRIDAHAAHQRRVSPCAPHMGWADSQAPDDHHPELARHRRNAAGRASLASFAARAVRGARVLGLCLGAFVVAAAGLLDERRATTHWKLVRRFRSSLPRACAWIVTSCTWTTVRFLTSAGTAAAIDCCLHLLRRDLGAGSRQLRCAPHGGSTTSPGRAGAVHRTAHRRHARNRPFRPSHGLGNAQSCPCHYAPTPCRRARS
jgi:hypothetical protein